MNQNTISIDRTFNLKKKEKSYMENIGVGSHRNIPGKFLRFKHASARAFHGDGAGVRLAVHADSGLSPVTGEHLEGGG